MFSCNQSLVWRPGMVLAVASVGLAASRVAANLGVTPGTNPVVGITLGEDVAEVPAAPGPVWAYSGGYSPAANGGAGGYFPTAANVLVGTGGYNVLLSAITAVSAPAYPFGSSGSFSAAGAAALTLPPAGTQVAQIQAYQAASPQIPQQFVYDFAQSSSNYAGLIGQTNVGAPPQPGSQDFYNLGSGGADQPGYFITGSPVAPMDSMADVEATVSGGAAGVFWPHAATLAAGATDTLSTVSVSTGAIDATNNAATGVVGHTRLLWSASGVIDNIQGFVEFGLNGAVTVGSGAAPEPIGAGPIVFYLQANINGPPTGFLATGSTANQISLSILGKGTNSSSRSFSNGDFVGEGYSLSVAPSGGYDYSFWAISLSDAFTLASGQNLAGTATATIVANTSGNALSLDPTQLPSAYTGDAEGFGFFPTPEPAAGLLLAVGGGILLLRRKRVGLTGAVRGCVHTAPPQPAMARVGQRGREVGTTDSSPQRLGGAADQDQTI